MTSTYRSLGSALLAGIVVMFAFASQCQAGWGHHRIVTSYSTPSVPVYMPAATVESAYRPVIIAPAVVSPVVAPAVTVARPVVVAAPVVIAPQTTYYAPAAAVPQTTYYAPAAAVSQTTCYAPAATQTSYYAPAPAVPQTSYYAPGPAAVVPQTIVARRVVIAPAVRATYYTPGVIVPAPVIVP